MKVWKGLQLPRNLGKEVIIGEVHLVYAGEPSKLCRDAPCQLILKQMKKVHASQVTELNRDAAYECIDRQVELDYARTGARL